MEIDQTKVSLSSTAKPTPKTNQRIKATIQQCPTDPAKSNSNIKPRLIPSAPRLEIEAKALSHIA